MMDEHVTALIDFVERVSDARDVMCAMCRYVKQKGVIDDDDRSIMASRGLFVTGNFAEGIRHFLNDELKFNGMVAARDYLCITADKSLTYDKLRKTACEFNGKLIIIDCNDEECFSGTLRVRFWKRLLADKGPGHVSFPGRNDEFDFNGCMICFSDKNQDELQQKFTDNNRGGGRWDWDAIWQRFQHISTEMP